MILVTKLITPDGTELISRHRHDYVTYLDRNGKEYMIDGGRDYVRCSAHGDEKFEQITINDKFEVIRDNYTRWNMYSKKNMKLKDISDVWLQNILDYFIKTEHHYSRWFRLYLEEKLYRAENEIFIKESPYYAIDY